ncbi:MAG: DUF2933 domain-containing protein [Candidatus Magasanikbacteria bacterium]|nr:DUF2933 domain-containing protein [Candidatus Magasanikbacteria bacterium]
MQFPKLSTMLGIGIAVVAAIIILPRLFPNLGGNSLVWLFVIACPLLHVFMMKGHGGHGQDGHSGQSDNKSAGGGCCKSGGEKKEKEISTDIK